MRIVTTVHAIVSAITSLVAKYHAELAGVLGALAALNVTPNASVSDNKYAAALLLGFAAITKAAAKLAPTAKS